MPEVQQDSVETTAVNLGYEAQLWQMADALRGSMDAAEYKHVVLGLIFLKYTPTRLRSSTPGSKRSGTRVRTRKIRTSTRATHLLGATRGALGPP